MSVMKRKLFNREARDELRRMGGIMASSEPLMQAAQKYETGGIVDTFRGLQSGLTLREKLANPLFFLDPQYYTTPDEENPMLQMVEAITPVSSLKEPEMTGLEQFEEDMILRQKIAGEGDNALRARVAELAAAGNRAGEIADALGKPLVEILDVGAGLLGAGLLETTAFASDIMSAFQSGIMGNQASGEFYGGIASDIKDLSDRLYYSDEDQLMPRVSTGLTGEGGLLETPPEEDKRALIEAQAMTSPTMRSDISDEPFVEKLPGIPEKIIQARRSGSPDATIFAGDALRGASDLDYGQGIGSLVTPQDPSISRTRSSIDRPQSMPRPDAAMAPEKLRQFDFPLTVSEEMAEAARLRGDSPLTMGQTTQVFPGEEAIEAEREEAYANLDRIKANRFREQERRRAEAAGMRREDEGDASVEELQAALDNLQPKAPETADGAAEIPKSEPEKPNAPVISTETAEKVVEEVTGDADPDATSVLTTATNQNVADMINEIGDVKDDKSADAYIDKFMKRFQKEFGEDEDQAAKDKAFAMAMFGATFASTGDFGQATAAMVDILRGDQATRQAREDKFKMMAIEAGLAKEAADLKYKRDVEIAGIRASSSDSKYTSERERSRLKEVIMGDPFAYPGLLDESGQIDAAKLNRYLDSVVTGSVSTGGGNATLTAKEANDAAKARGEKEFVYNGMRYPVR